jgi:hypothetical protein
MYLHNAFTGYNHLSLAQIWQEREKLPRNRDAPDAQVHSDQSNPAIDDDNAVNSSETDSEPAEGHIPELSSLEISDD